MEKKRLKLLIVDDEPGWRDLLSLELASAEHEIVTAANAVEAFEILCAAPFDVVITDVRMPGDMDGLGLIQRYRAQQPRQKAIFMTGYAIEESLQEALKQENVRCLRKPFESRELLSAIDSLILF